jgi:repressor LexA
MLNDDRLYDVMRAIDSLSREHGYCPTVREIGVVIGVRSPSTVHVAIKVLKNRGWATCNDRIPRSLRLTDIGQEWVDNE